MAQCRHEPKRAPLPATPRTAEIFPPRFSDDLLVVTLSPAGTPNLTTFLVTFNNLYGTLYPALPSVTRPLHRHLRPFTTNGALFNPLWGHLPPVLPWGNGLCRRQGAGKQRLQLQPFKIA